MVKKNLVLLGMMGVGKSTLGKIVANKQKIEFIDTDEVIEMQNSMTVAEIFKKKGEKFFRNEEEKEVLKSLQNEHCVIALGGGAFMNSVLRESILKNAISIWLDVNIKTLNKRMKRNIKRPLLNVKNNLRKLEELYEKRRKIYKLANHKISCDGLEKEDIINKIITLYEQ
tara:strand:- start:353 stop:862 length:510 start_codon:yes stop_codon:yes gene_type:complete